MDLSVSCKDNLSEVPIYSLLDNSYECFDGSDESIGFVLHLLAELKKGCPESRSEDISTVGEALSVISFSFLSFLFIINMGIKIRLVLIIEIR